MDVAADHQLQVVYGAEHHALEITTTTEFHNDHENGTKYGDQVNADRLNNFPLAIDSWLTMGAASDHHVGVPQALDTDGSILECPPYSKDHSDPVNTMYRTVPLCVRDGLLARDRIPEVVNFRMDPSYLHRIRGSTLRTIDGAWAVLGGTNGFTERNTILIAQLSTTGELSFQLNLQIRTPDGEVVNYVAKDPIADEIQYPGLSHGALKVR